VPHSFLLEWRLSAESRYAGLGKLALNFDRINRMDRMTMGYFSDSVRNPVNLFICPILFSWVGRGAGRVPHSFLLEWRLSAESRYGGLGKLALKLGGLGLDWRA